MSEERDWGRAYIYMEYMHWAHPVCPYIPTLHPSPHCPHPQMLWGPLSLWLSIGFDNWRCQQEPREWEGTPVRVFMSWSPPCWWSASFHLRWHLCLSEEFKYFPSIGFVHLILGIIFYLKQDLLCDYFVWMYEGFLNFLSFNTLITY